MGFWGFRRSAFASSCGAAHRPEQLTIHSCMGPVAPSCTLEEIYSTSDCLDWARGPWPACDSAAVQGQHLLATIEWRPGQAVGLDTNASSYAMRAGIKSSMLPKAPA